MSGWSSGKVPHRLDSAGPTSESASIPHFLARPARTRIQSRYLLDTTEATTAGSRNIAKTFESQRDELKVSLEPTILVSVALPNRPWLTADPLEEIRGLAETAGAKVVGQITQKRLGIEGGTYIGRGKMRDLVGLVKSSGAEVIVFDNDLTPGQVRNLEKATECKVIDRSELILDIFATRARTIESRLQVELAQLEYSLPRLKQMWTHLSRTSGGIGVRGPGETQLEEDRRMVGHRIRDLKGKLLEVQNRRQREVLTRAEEFTVSLVGYTNAGKSQLMNALTNADVYVQDQLFSTLETRTRQWHIKDFGKLLLSDTVGFIRDLPHHLVASFRATLEEARQSRMLLHVVDASSPVAEDHIRAVMKVLKELGCDQKKMILVLNKIDRIEDRSVLHVLMAMHPRAVAISGKTGEGFDELRDAVIEGLTRDFADVEIEVSQGNGRVLSWLNVHAEIDRQEYVNDEVHIRCRLPRHLMYHIQGDDVRIRPVEIEVPVDLTEMPPGEVA